MNILAIDTSNQTMGVAVLKAGRLAGEYITDVKKNHSVRLMPAINQLMSDVELHPKDLDKIVVAKGPGSYTGVRIGLSTAKTMAWTLGIPVVGISSLEVVALHGILFNQQICSFFDARRGLVYTGLYQGDSINELKPIWDEENVLFEEWLIRLKEEGKPTVFLSQDIELHKAIIEKSMGDLAIIPDDVYHVPRPSLLAFAGMEKQHDSVHALIPNYLRLAEAEANWLKQQEKENNG
ncbi:tRNA (adenosine(37)-N6)-threonylcarbamoyltransferase complex dimerization subunit type 1 TsaB [Aquibacillus salsiterrae]|uniref:tRNA (Adenosine(37)-N6)-threonylcarbamoyltransferase complex dimerization subunit type 1 TsaB n=1 Tax=Aquibacillus salsiterrae TaxID=2950439 RepID=A0A9X3WJQ4_9BACI|nr:tRNA (adenosine(37)-N6)-threonylcarbamoyltransferase complex dimerization subunit type 1 TsaB [Aquibacillus salsiterrae]MDC3418594.1 tRNA (adenosine(37)-N6)-threonylcarbamoyltransferase complex dimerization subunit type 1 TsaB [Aquibacillus salsiterrae]